MVLSQRSILGAWSLGLVVLSVCSQMSPDREAYRPDHGPLRVAHANTNLDAFAPAPAIPDDQLAFSVAPRNYNVYASASAPRRYTNHQVEIWSGSRKELLSLQPGQTSADSSDDNSIRPIANVEQVQQANAGTVANNVMKGVTNVFSEYWNRTHTAKPVQPQAPVIASKPLSKPSKRWMLRYTGVTEQFMDEISTAMSTIPQRYLDALGKSGYRVAVSRVLTDVVPDATKQQVRGYEASTTWKSVYGMFNRTKKRLVMAELADQSKMGYAGMMRLTDRQRRTGILRHEFGHAVDQYLGNYSHTPEFLKAYEDAKATLSWSDKQALSYFLQPGKAGSEEMFAELFACIDGSGCDAKQDAILRDHFGQLISMIRTKVNAIRA